METALVPTSRQPSWHESSLKLRFSFLPATSDAILFPNLGVRYAHPNLYELCYRLSLEVVMIRLIVRVIINDPETGQEIRLVETEPKDQFNPDYLEAQIQQVLDNARRSMMGASLAALRPWQPEISVLLTADEEDIRLSLRLSAEILKLLAEAGASFDFDPYV